MKRRFFVCFVLLFPSMAFCSVPSGWPVEGKITSGFGPRRHPITGRWSHHNGIDIRASTGTPVRATASGTVKFAGWNGGMGRTIVIDHGNGLSTKYGHLSRIKTKKGKWVERGKVIAYSGSSGRSTGPHLYFEIKKGGKPIDPVSYLAGRITDMSEKIKTRTETIAKKERERLKIIPGYTITLLLPKGSSLEKRRDYWKVIYPPGRDGEYRIEKSVYHGAGIGKIEIKKTL